MVRPQASEAPSPHPSPTARPGRRDSGRAGKRNAGRPDSAYAVGRRGRTLCPLLAPLTFSPFLICDAEPPSLPPCNRPHPPGAEVPRTCELPIPLTTTEHRTRRGVRVAGYETTFSTPLPQIPLSTPFPRSDVAPQPDAPVPRPVALVLGGGGVAPAQTAALVAIVAETESIPARS